jgi:hypothetical protein
MNMIMKNFKSFTAIAMIICCILFSSCGVTGSMNMGRKIKNVEIGMTKKEVIDILGNTYEVMAARDTPDGTLEVLRYSGFWGHTYIVNFVDGKLVEWFVE